MLFRSGGAEVTRPGTYRLVPDIQDPKERLRNYDVTVVPGSLVVVDREGRSHRAQVAPGQTLLEAGLAADGLGVPAVIIAAGMAFSPPSA